MKISTDGTVHEQPLLRLPIGRNSLTDGHSPDEKRLLLQFFAHFPLIISGDFLFLQQSRNPKSRRGKMTKNIQQPNASSTQVAQNPSEQSKNSYFADVNNTTTDATATAKATVSPDQTATANPNVGNAHIAKAKATAATHVNESSPVISQSTSEITPNPSKKSLTKAQRTQISASNIAKTAILAGLSYFLYMFVKFPLAVIFPKFLEIQFSDLPALLGGFSMGPIYACAIILVKCLLKMPFSDTACVGEIGDILLGIAFVLPATLIYQRRKSKKTALLGIVVGMFCSTAFAVLVNRFLLIPYYVVAMFGGNIQPLVGMVSVLYPDVTAESFYTYYLLLAIIPFNLLRLTITGALSFLVYKPLSKVLHWHGIDSDKSTKKA